MKKILLCNERNKTSVMEVMQGFWFKKNKACYYRTWHAKHERHATYHEEQTILLRAGKKGSGQRKKTFLPTTPDGCLCCCEKLKLASVQTTGAVAISVSRETALSLDVQVAEGGRGMLEVSILLLNLEKETNPRSNRATVLSETSHGDGVFKVHPHLTNSTVFIKTLHLGLRLIHGETPHGHRQSGS